MALTDKSAIPLNLHDLRVVEGERCFLDRRINVRLGYGRGTEVRDLIRRNKEDFEARFGNLRHRAANYSGAGRPTEEYWLTKGQALWVCRKSDARNADDVMEEIIKVFLAVDAGVPIPDTPWTDALLAPDKPTVTRGDGNIVHVRRERPLQPELFDEPTRLDQHVCEFTKYQARQKQQIRALTGRGSAKYNDEDDEDDALARKVWLDGGTDPIPAQFLLFREQWQEQYADVTAEATLRCDQAGDPFILRVIPTSRPAGGMIRLFLPGERKQLLLCMDATIPRPMIDSALTHLDALTPMIRATLDQLFD